MNKSEESLLHQQLSVKDDQFGAGRYEIVAFVELEKLDENLIFIIYNKNKRLRQTSCIFMLELTPCFISVRIATLHELLRLQRARK